MDIIKKIKESYDKTVIKILLFLFSTPLFAINADDPLGGATARKMTASTIKNWKWVFALGVFFIPVIAGAVYFYWAKGRMRQQQEEAITPKKLYFQAGIAIVIVFFIELILFVVFATLLNTSFTALWSSMVATPLKELFGITTTTTTP